MDEQQMQALSQELQDLDKKLSGRPLTASQRSALIARCNSQPLARVLYHILRGEVSFNDMPDLAPNRKEDMQYYIDHTPNPAEQRQWEQLNAERESARGNADTLAALRNRVQAFLAQWNKGSHAAEAQQLLGDIDQERQDLIGQIEEDDWQVACLNGSREALLIHLRRYPQSTHADEIDDDIWAQTDKEKVGEVRKYQECLPNGRHAAEAKAVLEAIVRWNEVKNSGDIFDVQCYIEQNPDTPFKQEADWLRLELMENEMRRMKAEREEYPVDRLQKLLSDGVISEKKLINERILSPQALQRITHPDQNDEIFKRQVLQVIGQMDTTKLHCRSNATDVYIFGVPSTGKTCILMGLSNTGRLILDPISPSAPYANALSTVTQRGLVVPPTPGEFFTMLNGSIRPPRKARKRGDGEVGYYVNLVEMSGETFANEIAFNPEGATSFEQMARGVTQLLQGPNEKVFFIVIDPTQDYLLVGKPPKTMYVDQRQVLERLVGLFTDQANRKIMDRVMSIHFVTTKADRLAEGLDARNRAAEEIFFRKYANCLKILHDVCRDHSINAATQLRPKLYTYSLGQFYPGSIYDYDPTDADRLLTAICNSMNATREPNFVDKLKDWANQVVW